MRRGTAGKERFWKIVLRLDRVGVVLDTWAGMMSMRKRFLPALALHLALVLALRAQQIVTDPAHTSGAVWLFGAAVGLFWAAMVWWPSGGLASTSLATAAGSAGGTGEDWGAVEQAGARSGMDGWQWGAAAVTVGLAFYAYAQFGGNMFTRAGVIAWVLAVGVFGLAFSQRRAGWWKARWQAARRGEWTVRLRGYHLALLLLFGVALFMRVYRLAEVPAELGSDQAEKLLDVQDVLNGLRPIFFPRNTGREAFQFYLTAALIRWTPLEISHLALKVGTVLISLMAFPFTYLLGKELFDRRLGVLAAALLSISHWHMAISRVGLRFPFTPAFAAATLYFLVRALRYNGRNDWLACGFFLGVGLHTYIPMRIVPLLLLLLVLVKAALDWGQARRGRAAVSEVTALSGAFWGNGALAAVMSFLVFLPLFRFMVEQPAMFWYRVTTRSSDALEQTNGGETLAVFWQNVKNAALMFNYRGDVVFANTIPFSPVLDWLTGGLFVLGLAYLLWRLAARGDRRSLYVLLMLFMLVLPSMLSIAFPNENPSVVRAGGAIPIAMIMAALPLWATVNRFVGTFARWGRVYAATVCLAVWGMAFVANYNWYFVQYDAQFRRSIWNASEMGEVVRGFVDSVGDFEHAYHIPYPYWVDTRAIGINAGNINWGNVVMDVESTLAQHKEAPATRLYIYYLPDKNAAELLREAYPDGLDIHYRSAAGADKDFGVFFVPGE